MEITRCVLYNYLSMMIITGDNWQVECSTDYWRRDDPVRFKHSATQK